MRVIAGEFRSRCLKSLPGVDLRPTPDRLREALFNVLAPRIAGCVFLDAYAGTGAVGIEALSRGAERAVFIEQSRGAAALIRDNLHSLGIEDRARVILGRASLWLGHVPADIAFLDPPYRLENEYNIVLAALEQNPPPLVVVQHASRFALADEYAKLRRYRTLKQGDNSLSFFGTSA